MFKAALDYHELNAGAHRKPPKILTAPSLVRYLAFWTNFSEPGSDGKKSKREPAAIRELLDGYILALCEAIDKEAAGLELSPCISGTCLLFGRVCRETSRADAKISDLTQRQLDIFESTARSVSLQFVWKKLDVTIRFEIYTEYFSISTFVELDKTREKIKSGSAYSDSDGLDDSIKLILGYLGQPGQSSDDDLTKQINRYCFHDFWDVFEQEILWNVTKDKTFDPGDKIFEQIFADFRGLVVSEQAVKFPDGDFFKGNRPAAWGQEAKIRFLPLIQHRDRSQRTRHECAANYMLDGRALYMSTLGPQLPSMPAEKRIPVEFIVYAHQRYSDTTIVNKWQLGRLVNQIVLLGTLRLAALKDVKSLHAAGQLLGRLEEVTQAAREAIASTEAEASAAKENRASNSKQDYAVNSNLEQKMEDVLGNAHKTLNAVAGDFLNDTGSGLSYRIERSRFYVKQFDDNVKLLRIQRLEGAQPYDQFIRRRLGSEFDFIDRLGIRYERATRAMETLDQSHLATIQTKIDQDTNSIQVNIQRIQEWGEFALLAALVPYYVAHLLDLIIAEKYVMTTTVIVWTVSAAFAFYRLTRGYGPPSSSCWPSSVS
jgi:hypothetical protein